MKADGDLVEEVKRGNVLAFSKLVERHQRALLRLCLRLMRDLPRAEDVVQEALVKAYQKIHLFEGRSSFKNWLFQIAVNTAKNKMRSYRGNTVNIDDIEVIVESQAQQNLENIDLRDFINQHVDSLPEKQRTALILRTFEDLSFKEIAKIMNCPYDTAKANYRHAIVKLRQLLANDKEASDWNINPDPATRQSRYKEVDQ